MLPGCSLLLTPLRFFFSLAVPQFDDAVKDCDAALAIDATLLKAYAKKAKALLGLVLTPPHSTTLRHSLTPSLCSLPSLTLSPLAPAHGPGPMPGRRVCLHRRSDS